MNSNIRGGRFTSSGIAALMTNGKLGVALSAPAMTYIREKNYERGLGRCIGSESNARETSWGNFMERRVFDLLGTSYSLCSQETIIHPDYADVWCGSPDGKKHNPDGSIDAVIDIKCPFTLNSFCTMVECETIQQLRDNHKKGDTYFWQLVSNAILTGANHAELIIYVPYLHEIEIIRDMTSNYDGDQNKIAWINFAHVDELPYILREGTYKNLNVIRFEVTEGDKMELINKVEKGMVLLKPRPVKE